MNSQINSEQISKIEDIEFEQLPIAYRKKSIIVRSLFSLIFGIPIVVAFFFSPNLKADIALSFIILLLLSNIFYAMKSYFYTFYAIREKDILYRSGIFFQKIVVIPFNRIQHVEMKQSPLDRKFGLAKLIFFTAGGSASDLKLAGVSKTNAENIRQFIVEEIGKIIER